MIALTVNGRKHEVDAPADKPLLWVLREDLDLIGTEVRLRRRPVRRLHRPSSTARRCAPARLPAATAAGKTVVTIEGLGPRAAARRAARLDRGAGAAVRLLPARLHHGGGGAAEGKPKPTDPDIDDAHDQHLPLRHLQRHSPRRASRGGAAGGRVVRLTRRKAMIGGFLGAGFLGVGCWFAHERDQLGGRTLFNVKPGEAGLNGWVKIARDNSVIVAVPRAEMGQGVQTALAMLVAEEMEARWDQVRVEDPPRDGVYRNVDILIDGLPFSPSRPAPCRRRALGGGQVRRRAGRGWRPAARPRCATPGFRCARQARWRATCCCARPAARPRAGRRPHGRRRRDSPQRRRAGRGLRRAGRCHRRPCRDAAAAAEASRNSS